MSKYLIEIWNSYSIFLSKFHPVKKFYLFDNILELYFLFATFQKNIYGSKSCPFCINKKYLYV